jgi:hypothetical protein
MVSASTALNASQYLIMFFAMGMNFFPDELMGGYGMDFMSCPAAKRGAPKCDPTAMKSFLFSVMNVMGIQMLMVAMVAAAMKREGVPKKAQSIACFVTMSWYAFNSVETVFRLVVQASSWPAAIDKNGMYFNVALFGGMAYLMYTGWVDSGSAKPDFSAVKDLHTTRFGKPILAGAVLLGFYGIPCVIAGDSFVEWFGRGDQMAGFTPPVLFMLSWMFFGIGVNMITSCVLQLTLASMGNDEVAYKVLRSSAIMWFYFFGASSKDHIIDMLESFDDPMRIFQFVTNFAVVFYQMNTFAKTPYTLKAK